MYDLLLKGGMVIDPGQGLEAKMDVAISGDRIAAVEASIPKPEVAIVIDAADALVTPGLIDFHSHVYWGATGIGIDADESCLGHGVTTVVDGGSSGSDNFAGFKRWVADASATRVLCFLNLSCVGLAGATRGGELVNPGYADPAGALEILARYPDLVLGLKLRLSERAMGGPCLHMLKVGREVAEEAGVPMMVHIGSSVEPLPEILELLRPGDIVTHCMTGQPHGLLDEAGKVLSEVREARERGILFDGAQARVHFSFRAAERLLDHGFLPDTISTDLTLQGTDHVVDLPTCMAKLLVLGLPLAEAVRLTTWRPAQMLGMADSLGTLKPGSVADVAVLRWEVGEFPLMDGADETRVARRRLVPHLTVRAGRVYPGQRS